MTKNSKSHLIKVILMNHSNINWRGLYIWKWGKIKCDGNISTNIYRKSFPFSKDKVIEWYITYDLDISNHRKYDFEINISLSIPNKWTYMLGTYNFFFMCEIIKSSRNGPPKYFNKCLIFDFVSHRVLKES